MKIYLSKGFTILELVAVLAIAGVLVGLAAPDLYTFVRNNRIKSQMFDLINSINTARSEAIKRKNTVTMCRTADPDSVTPACGGTSNTWTTGWIIFEDMDGAGDFDNGTDSFIAKGNAALESINIITNNTSDVYLRYKSDGSTDESGGTARFAICDERGGAEGKQVTVPPVGRAVIFAGEPGSEVDCNNPDNTPV